MKLYIKEKNGYPDNNFTKDEYLSMIKDLKTEMLNAVRKLDTLGKKQLQINEHGDYNSILTAEDEKDLYKRCALLNSGKNFLEMCELIENR